MALGLTLGLVPLAPASAETTIQLSGTITNTDGVDQAGVVCLELVGSGSCSGTNFSNGSWQQTWMVGPRQPGDYLLQVRSTTMDGSVRWYQSGNPSGVASKADATPVTLEAGSPDFSFTMVMPAVATLTGRVERTSGDGVSGATSGRSPCLRAATSSSTTWCSRWTPRSPEW